MNYKRGFIVVTVILAILVLSISLPLVYEAGVKDGRLRGLQCGTDTECEVLAEMLERAK